MSLPALTDGQCEELRSIALAMPVEQAPAATHELARQLEYIDATLPSKNVDELKGQMRTVVYVRILGGYSKEALSYMTQRVCSELNWFPTPHQCLTILKDYQPATTPKDKALMICAKHTQASFDVWIKALRTGGEAELAGVPDRWLRIAEEQGHLRCKEGKYERRN
jgi:hypothetical protein